MNNEYENTQQDLEKRAFNESNFHSEQAADVVNAGKIPPAAESQNQTNADDWAINTMVNAGNISNLPDPANSVNRTANAPNTNPLNEEKRDKWQMPEPVFRVSSGKKVEKTASPTSQTNSPKSPETSEPANSVVSIQPQPYISEAFIDTDDEFVIEEPTAEVASKTGSIIFIAAGILAMVLFAVGFLIGIYFLVFHTSK